MKTRRLGRTNLQVSEIGYGAWGIGKALWVGADDSESLRALHRAIDLLNGLGLHLWGAEAEAASGSLYPGT